MAVPLSKKLDEQVERIYLAYPKLVAKGQARKAIQKALQKTSFETLMGAVEEYARACQATGLGREFIPYPATWFNQERWDDDRSEWWRKKGTGKPGNGTDATRVRSSTTDSDFANIPVVQRVAGQPPGAT